MIFRPQKLGMMRDQLLNGQRGRHADQRDLAQSALQPPHALGAIVSPRNHFGDDRIILRRNRAAGIRIRIHAHAVTGGQAHAAQRARAGHVMPPRILRGDAARDGVTASTAHRPA